MSTEKDPYTVKKLGPTETTGEDNDTGESGEIKTLREKWLQKKKQAAESDFSADGTTNLVITMPEGESFSGSLIWYAVDAAGNKSDYTVIDNIKITNEKAEYEIRPSEVLLYKPSYDIEVISPGNTISYRWRKAATGRTKKEDYLFTEYRTAADGKINTADDPETASLDGEYSLELKIQTPSGQVTLYPQKSFVFDGKGPEIRLTVPETAYNTTAGTAVSIDDRAGVTSAKGVIVTPRGEAMAKQTEFTIPVVNGAVENYTPNLSDLSSGAYALKITATDSNGHTETITSKPFYIRYGAPTGSVSIKSDNKHDGFPMITDGKNLTLDFDITESFQNAACADGETADEQTLYYRVDTTDASGASWREAGTLTSDGDTLTFKGSNALTDLEFIEGKNTLYVQTMIYPKGAEITRVNTVNIADYTLEFYLDETAPEQPNVYINDIHTTGSVSGWIEVADNSLDFEDFGGMLTAECGDKWKDAVTIGGYSGGAFSITATKNVTDAEVYIYDEAKNKVTAVFSVYGIDNEPPDTSEFSWRQVTVGDTSSGRKDAEASVTIREMLGEAQFALIKKDDLSKAYTYSAKEQRNVIKDDYFNTVYYEESTGVQFTATKLSSEDAYFDGEVNNSYRLTIAGANGDWYVGVRAQDAVGNICDVVYGADTANGYMTTVNAAASVSDWSVAPHNAETKAVVTVSFNIPVYAEVKTQKNDDYLESVPENAQSYSQKTSFTITDYGTYYLYTADDRGRTSCSEIKVEQNTTDETKLVTFGSSSGVTYSIKEKQHDPNNWNSYIFADLPANQTMICPANFNKAYVLIVEPVTVSSESGSSESSSSGSASSESSSSETGSSETDSSETVKRTLLLPATGSDANSDAHGFSFSYDQSRTKPTATATIS